MKSARVNAKISGMHCASCVAAVENAVTKLKGVKKAKVNLSTEDIFLTFDPVLVSLDKIGDAVDRAGYKLIEESPDNVYDRIKRQEQRKNRTRMIVGFAVGLPLMIQMYIQGHMPPWFNYLIFAVATPVFLFLSAPIFKNALSALRNRNLTMDVMYALGIGVAYVASVLGTFSIVLTPEFMFYETAIMLAAFLTLGRYLESRARGRTSEAIKKLAAMMPQHAWVKKNSDIIKTPINEIEINDIIIVKPGERVPVDGTITEGQSYIDESMATGESMPVNRAAGMDVIGGTISKNALTVRVTRVGENTFLAQIIKLVGEAQMTRPPVQKLADRVVNYLIPAVLVIAVISFAAWYFIFEAGLLFALTRFIAVVVVACPCALGLATPTAITVGLGRGAELGILIKNSEVLELSNKAKTVVMDKTGTITEGRLTITDIKGVRVDDDELLTMAASVENYSEHPIAEAFLNVARERNLALFDAENFENAEGQGVEALIDHDKIMVGNASYMSANGISVETSLQEQADTLKDQGKTVVYIGKQGKCLGIIALADRPKEDSANVVSAFKKSGYDIWMLTGDNRVAASAIASQVMIDNVKANVLPGDKAKTVLSLQENGKRVIFIGDGINDAPALAQADIGIAMGQGTDIAIETGDIVLVRSKLRDALAALQLGKKVMQRIRQNIFWAFAYNIALIPVAAGLMYPLFKIDFRPEFAGLAMALSSITVVTLSLFLRNYTPSAKMREPSGGDQNGDRSGMHDASR